MQSSSPSSSDGSRKRKHVLDRPEFLDQLVIEFQTTKSKDAKEQVLANLANFAYDPKNYNYFRELRILDLFIDNLADSDETIVKFSIGGLCNLCLDPINKSYINKNGLKLILNLLEHKSPDVIFSVLTTLMFLIAPESKHEITNSKVIKTIHNLSQRDNVRLKNLATIFLEDYCTEDQIKEALSKESIYNINLS